MIDLIPYFAGLIMVLFGIAFFSAMSAFRKMANESEVLSQSEEASAGSGSGPSSRK